MAITKWLRELSSVSTPVVLTQNDTVPADWLQVPDGGSVTFIDGSGNQQTFTGLDPKDVFRVAGGFRTIVHSSERVRVGTGEGPGLAGGKGDKGDQGDQGPSGTNAISSQIVQTALTADDSAAAAIAETFLGVIAVAKFVQPWVQSRGSSSSSSTFSNYASITFKLYRNGSVINTWVYGTDPSPNGMGNLTNGKFYYGGFYTPSYQAAAGDHMTYTQTKAGTGVVLPVRSYGFTCSG